MPILQDIQLIGFESPLCQSSDEPWWQVCRSGVISNETSLIRLEDGSDWRTRRSRKIDDFEGQESVILNHLVRGIFSIPRGGGGTSMSDKVTDEAGNECG